MKPASARIIKSASFAFIVLALFLAINQVYIGLLPSKIIEKRTLQFEAVKDDVRILFMGDSHVAFAADPGYTPNSFNFASEAEIYEQTYYKARKILPEEKGISVVVLPIDLHSFSAYREDPYVETWYWLRHGFMSYPELSEASGKDYLDLYVKENFPVIGKGDELRVLGKGGGETIVSGWHESEKRFSADPDPVATAASRVNNNHFRNYAGPDEKLYGYFVKILDLAKTEGRQVVLIKYPVSGEYLSAVRARGIDIEGYYKMIDETASGYDNVRILDYQEAYNNLDLFHDQDHLNKWGAEDYSKRVEADFKRLGLSSA